MEMLDQDKIAQIATSAGLHLGCAVGAFVLVAHDGGEPMEEARAAFLDLCAQLFDETVAEVRRG